MIQANQPLSLVLTAGEPSGDRQAAALLMALREKIAPQEVQAWGIGGAHLKAAGARLLVNSDGSGSIGVIEALSAIPKGLAALARLKREMKKTPPDALVCVDAGAFNVPLGRWARANNICPVFYYFPPGSWRKTPRSSLTGVADRIVTPFPWSETLLRAAGEDAYFVGHPLLDRVEPTLTDADFYARFGLDGSRPVLALLPGSRRFEVVHNLPVMAAAADLIAARIPGAQFVVALPSPALRPLAEEILRREQRRGGPKQAISRRRWLRWTPRALTPPLMATNEGLTLTLPDSDDAHPMGAQRSRPAPLVIAEGLTYDVLVRADLVVTKSGTSTLEAAILHKPMVIMYRGSQLMSWEWKIRKKGLAISFIGLPNILAGERLVPELVDTEATPEAVSALAIEILLGPERLLQTRRKLTDLTHDVLGEPGGTRRAADLLYDLIINHEHDR